MINNNFFREKQIEEMASIAYPGLDHQTVFLSIVYAQPIVNLYNAGYRKKSEGEWNCKWKSTYPQYEPDEYCCSNCGCVENSRRNFCPECGAQMKGYKK